MPLSEFLEKILPRCKEFKWFEILSSKYDMITTIKKTNTLRKWVKA